MMVISFGIMSNAEGCLLFMLSGMKQWRRKMLGDRGALR